MKKTVPLFLLALALSVGFSLPITGCKPKKVEVPPPPPTPTPVIPPGSLVFVQGGHLVRLDLENSQITPLTSGKSVEWFPVCSPKGDQVVYWSNAESPDGNYNLWKIDLDGSRRTQLTFEGTNLLPTQYQNLLINDSASWSLDGKRILYSLHGDIWSMDPDGYDPETLMVGRNAICPFLSADGKNLYYLSDLDDTVFNLWSYSLSEKSAQRITRYTDWNVGSPSLSADGKKVLANLYRSNTTQIYTFNALDGSDPLNLTNNNRSLSPRFAQNDRKIVFTSFGTGEDVGTKIFMANANGTDIKDLMLPSGSSPSWAAARILVAADSPTPTPAKK
ncbi:MAG TPA: hypothetical protein VHE12_11470 [bacterium]|nr:hypothetical protein [bacterium]